MDNKRTNLTNRSRAYVMIIIVISVMLLFISRLFYLQVIESNYKEYAESNAFYNKTLYPGRGNIYDRNNKLIVYNQMTYDVMVVTREMKQPFDTIDFCNTLDITVDQYVQRLADIKDRKKNPQYSSYVPQLFMNHLSAERCGILQEKLYKFDGIYIQNRTTRQYNYPNAAHVLGDIGEVNNKDIKKDSYYKMGDYSGRSGIEKSYEKILRGKKGTEVLLRDAHGRIRGKYKQGEKDIEPIAGKNLKLSLDIELQAYAESLMQNKSGSIVVIEPETGEVLTLVSAPSFDPSLLVGRDRGKNNLLLQKDPQRPLFNRGIMAYYPPGSTFKPAQGLVFLQEEIIIPETRFSCFHGYPLLGGHPGCHNHPSPLDLIDAIATSCNAYFCWGLHNMIDNRKKYPSTQEAFETWKNHIVSMGYGYRLGIDLPGEKRGYIPNSKVYDKIYHKRWSSSTIISIAIGQGEITATPLQMANLAATVANGGYFYTPHVVKEIEDMPLDTAYTKKRKTTINPIHYIPIRQGMRNAVTGGTCRRAQIPGFDVCGKTGTAENPHGKDHSIFIGFAPFDRPKVAICVFVENGGFGATYAVPIGKLVLEKYLKGAISEEDKWLEENIKNTIIIPGHGIQVK